MAAVTIGNDYTPPLPNTTYALGTPFLIFIKLLSVPAVFDHTFLGDVLGNQ